jgi:hypothetical protein
MKSVSTEREVRVLHDRNDRKVRCQSTLSTLHTRQKDLSIRPVFKKDGMARLQFLPQDFFSRRFDSSSHEKKWFKSLSSKKCIVS